MKNKTAKITIVYDNNLSIPGLAKGWGFSALITIGEAPSVLFDTGPDGSDLLHNMKRLKIDPRHIGSVVISHAHFDHTGGLSRMLEINSHAVIYLPASIRGRIQDKRVVRVSQPVTIQEGIFSTGELSGMEQSLVVATDKGMVVVTGCSHPGVERILAAARHFGPLYGIVGGLHGFNDFDQLKVLSLICPCHCTEHKKELSRVYPEQYIPCGAGLELEL